MSAHDLIETGDTIVIGKARRDLALIAAAEIEELCNVLLDTGMAERLSESSSGLVVRGLSSRVCDLACAVMSALSDERDDTAAIAARMRIGLPRQEGRS